MPCKDRAALSSAVIARLSALCFQTLTEVNADPKPAWGYRQGNADAGLIPGHNHNRRDRGERHEKKQDDRP